MKRKNILTIIFIFITIFSIIIVKPINDLDEIWNYNTARVISEGLIPYKDVSMITTALLPMITAMFLKITTNEIIISRILAAILWTGIIFTTLKILEKLIKEENLSIFFTIVIGFLCRDIYCIDYNVAVLFMLLLILYQEIKEEKKNDFLIGILAGLAICTKQSIGVTLAGITVIYQFLFVENKEDFKEAIKKITKRIVGILIPVIIFIIYIILTGAMKDFINYAVLGIRTFSNKIPYVQLFGNDKIEIRILSKIIPIMLLVIPISLIDAKRNKQKSKYEKNILTMFIYSLSIIIVMYPISDKIHFLIGSLIAIILLFYIISILFRKIYEKISNKNKYKITKIILILICSILISLILLYAVKNMYEYVKQEKNTQINHYKNIEINEGLSNRIMQIDEYILKKENEGKKVYILDAEAAIYMIPINKYNKDYDMFLKGNIGKEGENGQIEKIKNRTEDELFLIRNKKLQTNWQTPTKVIEYIRENLKLEEEVSIYEVYR